MSRLLQDVAFLAALVYVVYELLAALNVPKSSKRKTDAE